MPTTRPAPPGSPRLTPSRPNALLAMAAAVLAATAPASARADAQNDTPGSLALDMSDAVHDEARAQAAADEAGARPDAEQAKEAAEKTLYTFGRTGSEWLTVGAGVANDFHQDSDLNLHVGYSRFIADDLEFSVELGGWYFAQRGRDTEGVSGGFAFRWHFLHDGGQDRYEWSIFGEAGIGLLFAFDNVPEGGTGFNFNPRLGVGYTTRLCEEGWRFLVGVRYNHFSNGRIEGDDRNPGRDSVMLYAGVMFPL